MKRLKPATNLLLKQCACAECRAMQKQGFLLIVHGYRSNQFPSGYVEYGEQLKLVVRRFSFEAAA